MYSQITVTSSGIYKLLPVFKGLTRHNETPLLCGFSANQSKPCIIIGGESNTRTRELYSAWLLTLGDLLVFIYRRIAAITNRLAAYLTTPPACHLSLNMRVSDYDR